MSRRLRTAEVQRLLHLMEQRLIQLRQTGWVRLIDGKPLVECLGIREPLLPAPRSLAPPSPSHRSITSR